MKYNDLGPKISQKSSILCLVKYQLISNTEKNHL